MNLRQLAIAAVTIGIMGLGQLAGCGSESTPEGELSDGPKPGPFEAGTSPKTSQSTQDPRVEAGSNACANSDPNAEIECSGRCGPVTDSCTGKKKECGGCSPVGGEPRVCDLTTNACIKPLVTCSELGAECGTVKNSCGSYLDCPAGSTKGCAAGKECDPDSHKCKDCQEVTCKDLGFECGFAWLGCGPNEPGNTKDCGTCGSGKVCNQAFNVCELACTPKSAKEICDAAKAARGLECGTISNGCGGVVNCDNVTGYGCTNGEQCGVRGIANRCDKKQPPDECKAAGRECGTITSACDGTSVACGDCQSGQTCNSNGKCGVPCASKTCDDFKQFQCGTFDDGCGSTVKCGTCASGVCDDASNTCCNAKACASDYPGKCGTALANGCGASNLSCGCTSGALCTQNGGATPAPPSGTQGSCCAPKTVATFQAAGQCGTNLATGCGTTVNVGCSAGQECVANTTGAAGPAPASGVIGSCCTRTDACNLSSGTCGPIQNSCRPAGTTYACNKCTSGNICNGGTTCCAGAPACAPGTGGGENAECNTVKPPVDAGCGSNRTCTCSGGRTCMCGGAPCASAADGQGACKSPLTCSSSAYAGKCGTGLTNGVGGTITCGCGTGKVCSTSTPGATGTCACNNPTGAPYTCNNVPSGPAQPGGNACGTFDNGCGGTLSCNCAPGQACKTSPKPNTCCQPAVCPAPGPGSTCGSINNGCTTVSCGCPGGIGNENFLCTSGTCQCTKDTCRGRTGQQPDRCGGFLACGG